MDNKDEIIFGAGELYMYEFAGKEIPPHETIETDDHNVGHCSGGFSAEYKPDRYDIKNQYGNTVKTVIKNEEITAKTGILSWDLSKLALLSTAVFAEDAATGTRKLTFRGKGALRNVMVRFVHTKDDGRKLRFTMIGQGGNGFSLQFGENELTVDATLNAISYIKDFLAEIEEEIAVEATGLTVQSAAGTAAGDTKITVTPAASGSNTQAYIAGPAAEAPCVGDDCTSYTELPSGGNISGLTADETIVVVERDAEGKAVKAGAAKIVVKAA